MDDILVHPLVFDIAVKSEYAYFISSNTRREKTTALVLPEGLVVELPIVKSQVPFESSAVVFFNNKVLAKMEEVATKLSRGDLFIISDLEGMYPAVLTRVGSGTITCEDIISIEKKDYLSAFIAIKDTSGNFIKIEITSVEKLIQGSQLKISPGRFVYKSRIPQESIKVMKGLHQYSEGLLPHSLYSTVINYTNAETTL
jgi:Holliday junction resolvase